MVVSLLLLRDPELGVESCGISPSGELGARGAALLPASPVVELSGKVVGSEGGIGIASGVGETGSFSGEGGDSGGEGGASGKGGDGVGDTG